MHVVWVNEDADFTGGCENYIYQSVGSLANTEMKSTLLYKVGSPKSPAFLQRFDQSFPMVDLRKQLAELSPDLIYVHSLNDASLLAQILDFPSKKIRFMHDQRALCLREHKYTTLGNHPCSERLGKKCITCLGFIKASEKPWKIGIKSLRSHQEVLAMNRKFDHIIVGSSYMSDQLKQNHFAPEKILTLPLFSLLSPASKSGLMTDNLAQSSNQKQQASKQILFAGQLVRGKGLDTLLDAIALCDETPKLIVCGTGKMAPIYHAQANALGIEQHVVFKGHQTTTQLRQHYLNSAAVIIPSRAPETFCLVGLEALLHGVPVIASNTGGMNEWFKPNINGLAFQANDEKGLATQIDRFISDARLQKRLRSMIAMQDYQRFAPEKHLTQVQQLLTGMMEAA